MGFTNLTYKTIGGTTWMWSSERNEWTGLLMRDYIPEFPDIAHHAGSSPVQNLTEFENQPR